jgi:HEAT repeat protein
LKDEGAANMISGLLSDTAGQVRVAVVEALANIRGARALEALHAAAAGNDPDVRRAALLGLGHVKHPASLPAIRLALLESDAATRLVALSALAEYELPEIAEELGRAVSDADDGVRAAAVNLLASRPGLDATRALMAQLHNGPMRARVVAALAQPEPGRVEALVEGLKHSTPETAPLLASALARTPRADAASALQEAFATQDVILRRAIAPALARLRTSTARTLLAHAASFDEDDEVRLVSAAALER